MMLDLENWQNKKYQTREGKSVRLLCVDGPGFYQLIGIVDEVYVSSWTIDGLSHNAGVNSGDLVNAPPEPVTITRWVNIYKSCGGGFTVSDMHDTHDKAKRYADADCIATVPVTITFTTNGR